MGFTLRSAKLHDEFQYNDSLSPTLCPDIAPAVGGTLSRFELPDALPHNSPSMIDQHEELSFQYIPIAPEHQHYLTEKDRGGTR